MSQKLQNTLSKDERIYEQKRIDALFVKGSDSFIAYPLRVVYRLRDLDAEAPSVSILVSVSKRRFKRAVKRNRIKRLVKEAFRQNKQLLSDIAMNKEKAIDIAFLYLKDELPEYVEIEKALIKTAVTLSERLNKEKTHEDIA